MTVFCKNCGGELKTDGSNYKCISCGATYPTLEAARPTPRRSITPTPKQELTQKDHGADIFEENVRGVLEITWSDGVYVHNGSGLLVTEEGYAVTNTHVVTHEDGRSCEQVTVKLCGEQISATVECLGDMKHGDGNGIDLAVIKLERVPRNAHVLGFGNFDAVRNGERIYVIGNSLGHGTCITSGIVSDRLRHIDGCNLMMTDCAINGGNSGGPVFNEKGQVIGVVVAGIDHAEGMNFAIPSNDVCQFMQEIGFRASNRQLRTPEDEENSPIERVPYSSGEFKGIFGSWHGKSSGFGGTGGGGSGNLSSASVYTGGVSGRGDLPPTRYAGAFEGLRGSDQPKPSGFGGTGKKDSSGPRPSIAPCPVCGSSGTVENGIFVCDDDPDHEFG